MPQLLGFPFRMTLVGSIVTHEQNSDEELGEELATLIGTRVGERVLSPGYGLKDFVFDEIDRSELELKVSVFEIPIKIIDVVIKYPTLNTQDVLVEFDKDKRKANQ